MTTCEIPPGEEQKLYRACANLIQDVGVRKLIESGTFGNIPLCAFYFEIPYLGPEIVISSVLQSTQIPFEVDAEEREKHIEAKYLSSFPEDSAILIGRNGSKETVVLFPESSRVIKAGISQLLIKEDGGLGFVHLLDQHPEDWRGLSLEELDMYSELIANVEGRFPVGEPLW